jgi:hypothetical protein
MCTVSKLNLKEHIELVSVRLSHIRYELDSKKGYAKFACERIECRGLLIETKEQWINVKGWDNLACALITNDINCIEGAYSRNNLVKLILIALQTLAYMDLLLQADIEREQSPDIEPLSN